MKISQSFLLLLAGLSAANAALVREDGHDAAQLLSKRRGGGGSGGGGGGRGGSTGGFRGGSSSGSSSSGSSRSSSGSSGSSSSGSVGRGSASSNAGGRTTTGSGVGPRFGGGRFYGGGATVPYRSGARSPGGILPLALIGGALLFWSALWLPGAYMYNFDGQYRYFNRERNEEEELPVFCICQPNVVCGCEENDDPEYIRDLIGDGTELNDTIVFIGEVNGTRGIYINGTLPNGTTAAGGTEDPNAGIHVGALLGAVGFWPVLLAVGAAVFL